MTAVEGTVAVSALVLLVGGLAVMAYSMVRLGSGHPFGMTVGWPSMGGRRALLSLTAA